jgi:hypothetical protein
MAFNSLIINNNLESCNVGEQIEHRDPTFQSSTAPVIPKKFPETFEFTNSATVHRSLIFYNKLFLNDYKLIVY